MAANEFAENIASRWLSKWGKAMKTFIFSTNESLVQQALRFLALEFGQIFDDSFVAHSSYVDNYT